MGKKKENDSIKIVAPGDGNPSNGKMSLEVDLPRDEYVICKVCGHTNPKNAGLCEMCSNYLFK